MDLTVLETSDELIAAGEQLSLTEWMQFLKIAISQPSQRLKLSPLLIGLPTPTFCAFLTQAASVELDLLKAETSLEPLQHQLTKVVTHLEQEATQLDQRVEELERYLENCDPSQMGQRDLFALTARLSQLIEEAEAMSRLAANALTLLWQTARTDLIDKCSRLKEHAERMQQTVIRPLTQVIQERLYRVYNELEGSAPATEGLAQLSVVLLHDYHALGLLSHGLATLMEKPANSEAERIARRTLLMESVQKQLKQVGLETVEDLKRAGIFSVKSLQEYLAETPPRIT